MERVLSREILSSEWMDFSHLQIKYQGMVYTPPAPSEEGGGRGGIEAVRFEWKSEPETTGTHKAQEGNRWGKTCYLCRKPLWSGRSCWKGTNDCGVTVRGRWPRMHVDVWTIKSSLVWLFDMWRLHLRKRIRLSGWSECQDRWRILDFTE